MSGKDKITLDFGGFRGEDGGHEVSLLETAGRVVSFTKFLDPEGEFENATFYAASIIAELQEVADERDMEVEDFYSGVIEDTFSYNVAAFAEATGVYPRRIGFGCVVHCLDLRAEDMAKVRA